MRGYHAALSARDFARARAAWGDGGPPGHVAQNAFAQDFAAADSTRVVVGTPGRVEGAAGSRYVTVPVTLEAFARGGRRGFAGTYTLRRSVVPGASAADARWHLVDAALRETTPAPGG